MFLTVGQWLSLDPVALPDGVGDPLAPDDEVHLVERSPLDRDLVAAALDRLEEAILYEADPALHWGEGLPADAPTQFLVVKPPLLLLGDPGGDDAMGVDEPG